MEEDKRQIDRPKQLPNEELQVKQLNIQDILSLTCFSPEVIYNNTQVLTISISIVPHQKLPNLPVEVDLKGVSHLHILNTFTPSVSQLQITQSVFFEDEEKDQKKHILMKESICVSRGNKSDPSADQSSGECFLEGSQVIFQLDDRSQQRLQTLQSQTEYKYPVEFTLPPNLPVSLQHKLLTTLHVTIKYSLEVRVSFPKGGKIVSEIIIIPFKIIEVPKSYPFEELVVAQKMRCYHQGGAISDQKKMTKMRKIVECLCPQSFLNFLYPTHTQFSTHFSNYDLFHLELIAVASKDHNIFFTVRAYKEPEKESLTVNRERKHKPADHEDQVPPQVSFASIKETETRSVQFLIQKVEVKMFGQFSGMNKETILSVAVPLFRTNYDMFEGESLVQLKDYLSYPYSCRNELFQLKYSFELSVTLGDQEESRHFQCFQVDVAQKELWL